jgi:hypothetical protein
VWAYRRVGVGESGGGGARLAGRAIWGVAWMGLVGLMGPMSH